MSKTPLKIILKKNYAVRPQDLAKARRAAGLSQEELAAKLDLFGWDQQNISNIESQLLPLTIVNYELKAFIKAGFKLVFNL